MTCGKYMIRWSLVERTSGDELVWANSQEDAEEQVRQDIYSLAGSQCSDLEDMEVEMTYFEEDEQGE